MNCISIAIFPTAPSANIKRVIEYFYPREGRAKIWVDIFFENPTESGVSMKVLHAGSLSASNVTDTSWILTTSEIKKGEHCEAVLTRRILDLHQKYCPISIDAEARLVWLDGDEYQVWTGSVLPVIGGVESQDLPFTLWELVSLPVGRSVVRLRLEMHKPTYDRRFLESNLFFAHGESIVLSDVESALRSYKANDASLYIDQFHEFEKGHQPPESFEYLIVSPDGTDLPWYAETLSSEISPKFIGSGLSKNTRWFVTDHPYINSWNFVLKIKRVSQVEVSEPVASAVD